MTTFLPVSYSDRPAFHPDELLPQDEIDAIIEREQAEADAFAARRDASSAKRAPASPRAGARTRAVPKEK